jgi:hypothetical protein
MAIQGEEDLVVAVDQLVPDLLAMAGQLSMPAVVGVRDLVRGQDDRDLRMLGNDCVGPLEAAGRGTPVHGEHQPRASRRVEDVVGVVAVGAGAAERRRSGEPLRPERLQVWGIAALVVGRGGYVVIAGQNAVVHAFLVQASERRVGGGKLACQAVVLGDVAEVGEKSDVVGAILIQQVLEACRDGRGLNAGRGVEHVLGVWHHRQRESKALRVRVPVAGER